jgi:hypothetical protein
VGWYSTGPRLREADVDINQLAANYCETPVLVICEVEVRPGCKGNGFVVWRGMKARACDAVACWPLGVEAAWWRRSTWAQCRGRPGEWRQKGPVGAGTSRGQRARQLERPMLRSTTARCSAVDTGVPQSQQQLLQYAAAIFFCLTHRDAWSCACIILTAAHTRPSIIPLAASLLPHSPRRWGCPSPPTAQSTKCGRCAFDDCSCRSREQSERAVGTGLPEA